MADRRDPRDKEDEGKVDVLTPVVSMAKMDIDELRAYTKKLNAFVAQPGPMAIRICECCVDVQIT